MKTVVSPLGNPCRRRPACPGRDLWSTTVLFSVSSPDVRTVHTALLCRVSSLEQTLIGGSRCAVLVTAYVWDGCGLWSRKWNVSLACYSSV